MGWNDSDDDKKDTSKNDPWSGHKRKDSPPDLDVLFRKFFNRFSGKSGGGSGGDGPALVGKSGVFFIGLLVIIVLVLWVISGIYIVEPAQQSVVLRFGKYLETQGPGPHWIPRFIDSATVWNTQKQLTFPYQAEMLTEDENIVSVSITVQYRINNLRDYLYKVVNPDQSLQQATASALRQVIGHTKLDAIMTSGRALVRQQVQQQLKHILSGYDSGLMVTDVTMQPAKAPDAVKEAFVNAIKAQEKEQQYINEAQAYARDVVPKAQGVAKRFLAEANAYKKQVVLRARGDVSRFLSVLPEFERAPKVTSERMYIGAVQQVLEDSTKILLDTKGSNNVLYLPFDKLLSQNSPLDKSTHVDTDTSSVTVTKTQKSPAKSSSYGGYGSPMTRGQYLRDGYSG